MEQSSERFQKWETNFIKIIQSKKLIGRDNELEFKDFIRNIESFNSLPPPYEKQTNHFLNITSPQIINFILEIHSLSSEIESGYETILRQYSQILGQQLTANKNIDEKTYNDESANNESFIQAASKIIESKNSNFYLLSEKIKMSNGKDPENYIDNCHVFATTANLELFTEFFLTPTMKSLSKIEKIIQIIFPISYLFDSEKLNILIQVAASKIWELVSNQNPRVLNITEIENTLVSLEKMTSSASIKFDVWKVQIDFSIKILKSGILTNQLSSLSTICRICNESPERISPILRDENLLNYLLKPKRNNSKILTQVNQLHNNDNNDTEVEANEQDKKDENKNNESNDKDDENNKSNDKDDEKNESEEKNDENNESEEKNDENNESKDNSNEYELKVDDVSNENKSESHYRIKLSRNQSFIGDDIHFELVNYIADIFASMYVCKCANDIQMKTLWLKSISQSQTTIGTFLKAMEIILSKIPKEPFFNMIIETNRFPESVLPFLRSISFECPSQFKVPIFNELHDLFFSGKNLTEEMENDLIETMLDYILDSDVDFCNKLHEECLNYIKSDNYLNYSLKILQNALFFMTSEKAHEAFETILNKLNKDSIEYLDLITKILKKYDSQINQNDFMALQRKTNEMIPDHSKDVCHFYQSLVDSKSILSTELILFIFNNFCSLPYNDDVFEIIKKLFYLLKNSLSDSIEIIDSIWKHLFDTNRQEVSSFLITIYTNLEDHDKAQKFISNCLKNLHCVGSLEAIKNIIHEMEDGVQLNKKHQHNRMLFSFDLVTVNLIYMDNKPRHVKVTYDTCYEGFKRIVIQKLNLNMSQPNSNVLLYDNSILFNHNNFKLYDNINVSVHLEENNGNETINNYVYDSDDILPSQILIQPNIYSPIFDILLENDQELSPIALNIFNIIPTLPSQITEINSVIKSLSSNDENSSQKVLEEFLCIDHPYLLTYRIHIIGNIALIDDNEDVEEYFSIKCNDFLKCFYQSGGIEYLLNIIFNFSSSSTFPKNHCINDLLRITKYLLSCENFHEIALNSIEKVKDKVESFLKWTIEVANENNDSFLTDIILFMKELTIYVVNFDDFSEIVKLTIFHKLYEIRKNILNIVNTIESISLRENLIVPLLPKLAVTSKCEEYFNLLTNIATVTEYPFNLIKSVIEALYANFTIPKKKSALDILLFDQPPLNYAHGIFKVLNILLERLFSIESSDSEFQEEDAEKLFKFLTDEIIFNPYKYYLPTAELFNTYLALLNKYGQFICFMDPIVKMVEDFKLSPKSSTSLSATARNRGIKNLGATCYMNSTIQQLFNIREFLSKILSAESDSLTQDGRKDWFAELQYDLAKLWLFPSNSINIQNFVSSWTDYDNEPVDPHRQQDSAEFLQLLIDRLEQKIEGISSFFTGQIEHRTIGVSVHYERKNYETFVIFPLEVKNLTSLNDSFRSFLQPDRFECSDEELGKFNALRHHHITKAPKILIVQLKRFSYDLMKGVREKINSVYNFTSEIDISPLMVNEDKVTYDLIGVVQHQGSADSGHYFSDVRRESGKWLCLNDNKCTKINGQSLPDEAAGGFEERTVYDEVTRSSKKIIAEKSTNAYILFYRLREEETEKVNLIVNEKTLERLLPAIKKSIFEAVCASPHFANLALKICQDEKNNAFLYKYTMNTLRIFNNQTAAETLISKCIGVCSCDSGFSDFILEREADFAEFIVFMKYSKVRKYYVSIIEAALANCSQKAHQNFYRYLLGQITESSQVICEMRQCIPELFQALNLTFANDSKFNNIDCEELLSALLAFVVDSIQLYDSKHKSDNIFSKVNLSNIFDLMVKLCQKLQGTNSIEPTKITIASKLFKSKIFTALTASQNHCNSLASLVEFLLLSNNQTKQLFIDYLSQNKKYLSVPSISLLLNLSMTISDQDLIDLFFDLIKTKSGSDIVLFFHSLEPICHPNRDIFMFNAQVWIRSFLLSTNISVRASLVNFIYKMFPDVIESETTNNESAKGVIINIYQNLIDSVPLLIQSISKLKKMSQNATINDDNIPTGEFFEILTWSVETAQMKDKNDIQAFVSLLQTFEELLRNVSNVSATVPQLHCLQYLVKLYGRQLFTLSSSITAASIVTPLNNGCKSIGKRYEEVVSTINDLLISVLPRFCTCYLKSRLFSLLLMNNFSFEASRFVRENLNNETVRLIANVLWNQSIFRKNCKKQNSNVLYLQTSWRIIKEYSETCEIIYEQQDFLLLLKMINNNSPIIRTAAKFLAEFNFAYEAVNRNKKFFISLKTQALYKKYKENGFKWKIIYDQVYHNRYMISPGNGGLCQFMRSMIALKTNPPQTLLTLISKSPKPFITTVIPTVQAAQLVCDLCVAFPDSGEAINCLIHEFSSINSCYKVVEIFCKAFAKMKRKNFWMDLQKPLKEIFLKSDDIEIAGETVLRMSEQLFDKNTLTQFRNKVLSLMTEEIRKIIIELSSTTSTKIMKNEYKKVRMGYDFISDITSTIRDRSLPQLDITNEESQKIIEIFKEHKFIKASDSFYLYLSKK